MRLALMLALTGAAVAADIEIPFEFLHNQIVLGTKVNGNGPYNFVLDTGTYASTIDLGLARRLQIPLASTRSESRGAGSGRVFGRTAVVERLAVGGLEVGQLPVVALDLSRVSAQLGRPLHGVLGNNFLASRITQIDYFRRRIRFLAESHRPPARQLPADLLPHAIQSRRRAPPAGRMLYQRDCGPGHAGHRLQPGADSLSRHRPAPRTGGTGAGRASRWMPPATGEPPV